MSTLQIESVTVHDANGQPYKLDCCLDVEGIKRLCADNAALRLALEGMMREFDYTYPLRTEEIALDQARAALAGTREEGSK